jgi:para-nitrobenzyl esterase
MSYKLATAVGALLTALTVWATLPIRAASDQVEVTSGVLEGSIEDGVSSFKGIPFAAPPVGDLRWRPPQPVTAWTGVRRATAYGSDCAQLPFPGDAAPLGTPPAEDCLVLNVWRPAERPAQKLPVMVWIYGGGFVNGGSSPAVYDGTQFARRGVVFVSFNYRLGRFGFFAHPALTKESPSGPLGNYGYLDQLAALRWVQANIAAFGGDPGNVTVFGESAGGGSVLMLLTSPLAKGLLHKAIIESGGGRDGLFPTRHLDKAGANGHPSAESVGVDFAKANGISGDDNRALAALRALPAEKLIAGLNMATMMTPTHAGPMVDGTIVVEPAGAALKAGRFAKVPVIAGANSADIGFSFAKTIEEVFAPFGEHAAKAREVYDPEKTGNVRDVGMLVAMDRMMVEPARFIVRTFAAAGAPAYHYRFSYVAESMRAKWKGAPHATEIPFVFDTVQARYGQDLAPADKAMAEATNAYWVSFAKTGDPNGPGRPAWPPCTSACDDVLDFANNGPKAGPDPWKVRLDLTAAAVDKAR